MRASKTVSRKKAPQQALSFDKRGGGGGGGGGGVGGGGWLLPYQGNLTQNNIPRKRSEGTWEQK